MKICDYKSGKFHNGGDFQVITFLVYETAIEEFQLAAYFDYCLETLTWKIKLRESDKKFSHHFSEEEYQKTPILMQEIFEGQLHKRATFYKKFERF